MSQSPLDSFLGQWRSRWPEWTLAEPFVPVSQRLLAPAWFSVLQQFEDIMNVTGEPLPADAKLAWWQQELRDWSEQRSRHPLGRLLEPQRAPWAQLADSLPAVQAARLTPASLEQALQGLQAFAEAVAAVERVVFVRDAGNDDARAIAVQWLHARAAQAGAAALPPGIDATGWRAELLRTWPSKPALARPRRIWSRLAWLRLRREHAGKPVLAPPLWQLWHSWRAASGGA